MCGENRHIARILDSERTILSVERDSRAVYITVFTGCQRVRSIPSGRRWGIYYQIRDTSGARLRHNSKDNPRFSLAGSRRKPRDSYKDSFMNSAVGETSRPQTIGGFSIEAIRGKFPALKHAAPFIFRDKAAGAQIPQAVFEAVNHHLLDHNVQRGGRYPKSQQVDATIARGRQSVADFLNARTPNEIAFGMNATSLIGIISLAIGQTLGERKEIVVTDMDHEANIATWLALERDGAKFRW